MTEPLSEPFDSFSLDGTEASVMPLTLVEKIFLKPAGGVIALRLESPTNDDDTRTVEQWALTRAQAEFLVENLQICLRSTC